MRSMWTGHIQFGMVTIPVKLYKSEETGDSISFNQLHKDDFGRVGYDKRCKKCGEVLSNSEIVKGYAYGDDQYVVVEDEHIDRLKVKSTKTVEVEGFLKASDISPVQYERSYFAGPDGQVAAKPYALFRTALEDSDRVAVGRIVISRREHVVAISAYGDGIVMYTIADPARVRDASEIAGGASDVDVKEKERKLSQQLVETMKVDMKEVDFSDHYQEALRELITAKVEGEEMVTVEEEEAGEPVDIMSALQASIDRAQSDREPMKKARGTKKKGTKEKATGS